MTDDKYKQLSQIGVNMDDFTSTGASRIWALPMKEFNIEKYEDA